MMMMWAARLVCPAIFGTYYYLYGLEQAAYTWLWTMLAVFYWWALGGLSIAVRDIRLCHTLHPTIAMINAFVFPCPIAVSALLIYYTEYPKRIPESKYVHHEGFWAVLLFMTLIPSYYVIWSLLYVGLGSAWYYHRVNDADIDHHEVTSVWQVMKPLLLPVVGQVVVTFFFLSLLQ